MMKMKINIKVKFCFLLFFITTASAQKKFILTSPDQNIIFTLNFVNNIPSYSVSYQKENLITNSTLNLVFADTDQSIKSPASVMPIFKKVSEDYTLVTGKGKNVHTHYKQLIILLKNTGSLQVSLEARVFNDGVAFRYLISSQNKKSFTLLDEQTQFNFSGDPIAKALLLENFTTSHEGLYTTMPLSKIRNDTLMDMPALFQFSGKIFVAITEAALLDYAGMYLSKHTGIICSSLSPLPNQNITKVVNASLPHHSPWRVILINKRIGALIESNIITSLNEPSKIKDVGWIKPGTSTFPWWNGTIVPDSIKRGNNFETNKYYIDFCAANNIKYHTIVEYNGHECYTSNGEWYQPGTITHITKPVAELDMQKVCDYAKQKNVGIRAWTHWKALYSQLDKAFPLFEKWGINGLMVDFMNRDDQEMVNIQTEILQKAALHHLHIQFHGAYKPTGLNRTYPNEFTREGTLNYEHDKWDNQVSPDADINIPFTRMLAGSTDYRLGGFRALPYSKFVVQNLRPYIMGTRCHMLAMYVVLENYLSMVCDYPDAYLNQPGFEVLKKNPTTWDKTYVPAAKVDEYISIARCKNDIWYIGTITNLSKREIELKLDFLSAGKYAAEIYSDASDADVNANHLAKQNLVITKTSVLKLQLSAGGGNLIILHKLK